MRETSDGGEGTAQMKNLINTYMHMFLFDSVSAQFIYSLIFQLLEPSQMQESDVEVLIFVLHNIGLQLRKRDPAALKELITRVESKKNQMAATIKMT
jgi:nucleolar MIF4G domain-containing protein 1